MKKSFFIIILVLAVLNGIFFYYSNCVGDYVQVTDVWGDSYLINKKVLTQVSVVLKSLPENHAEARAVLHEKINQLESFSYAVRFNSGDSTALYYWDDIRNRRTEAENAYKEFLSSHYKDNITGLEADINIYKAALENLDYKDNYDIYVKSISGISDDLLTVSLYKNNETWIFSNIMKTKKDFYGLDKIIISPDLNKNLDIIVNYKISDVLAVLICAAAALFSFTSLRQKTGSTLLTGQYNFLKGILLLFAAIVTIYSVNIILAEIYIGLGDLDISIQSCKSFKSCTFFMNTGSFLFFWVISKLVGCLIIYFAVVFIVANITKLRLALLRIIPVSLFFIVEFFFYSFDFNMKNSILTILKEINIFSAFDLHRFFTRYLNLDIFGLAVSRLTIFIVFISVFLLIFAAASVKGISSYELKIRVNAERVYYDEINMRYAEFRSIWHDMQNHLLVLNRLIESNDTDSAKRYINEVSEKLESNLLPVKTKKHGSAVLDALLFKKMETAKHKDIELTYNIMASPCDFGISDYDLCCIFGNILDNATEAVEFLNCGFRQISLTTSRQHEMLYICCENPYINEINEDKRKGALLTTKTDKKSHGIGLSRIKSIAKKHNGNVKITAENTIFKIEILLNSVDKAKLKNK